MIFCPKGFKKAFKTMVRSASPMVFSLSSKSGKRTKGKAGFSPFFGVFSGFKMGTFSLQRGKNLLYYYKIYSARSH